MKTRLRPLGNRVILKKIEEDKSGGVFIPKGMEQEEGTQEFEVVEVPAYSVDVKGKSPAVIDSIVRELLKPTDRIYLARHKGYKILTNSGEELYAADIEDVLAVGVDDEESEEVPF